ncbi:ABC transporter ATP-binding protein [Allostreptomyces psammosilenae]|uniref:ABC-2 type transport system ATP-binding protein n=1 Tax=Allostreptomyces psammosilenae TaxID=1892865 RepID=A0A853A9P4_9ACTN|nr:ABC transporter ATP-binding protein [Allostreptomyces psammosilenae]NYI07122.1 ABC-2 type transport system ATP-binding protein [Allostreptomyces psammosilenae]
MTDLAPTPAPHAFPAPRAQADDDRPARQEGCCTVRGLVRTHRRGRGRRATVVRANDGIDLDIARGEVFGLLGPNGAGKSTLVRQLAGLLRPDAGAIDLLGHDLVRSPHLASRLIGYLGQESTALDELPVALAVETTARLRGLDRARARAERDAVIEELGLAPLADTPLRRLSGGQRRLACVAAALTGDRPVLILDEPTTGMDPVARRAVWAALGRRRAEQGTTVLLVTHNVLEAEFVLDRVAVVDRGRVIACDTPGGLKALVADDVRLELVWRDEPPEDLPVVAGLAARATRVGRRWTLRMPAGEARELLGRITGGPALAALDDFRLTTPSLEDVYLALGGRGEGLVRT